MSLDKRHFILAFRLLIGGLFLYAGLSKIIQPYYFAASIQAYQFLPQVFVGLTAALIPWTETVSALALISGHKSRSALLIFIVLLILFMFIIGLAMYRGLEIDCGCGLLANRQVGWLVLTEDSVMLAAIAGLYFLLLPDKKPQ